MNFLLDPNVSYFLLVIGFILAVLALFAPGTGVIEVGAMAMLVLAGYGIANLPVNLWALALMVLGVIPMVLAVRKGGGWIWLAISILVVVIGSVFLFRNAEGGPGVNPILSVSFSTLAVGLMWFIGTKSLEASRRRPQHSLERLQGLTGTAESDIFQEGTVAVGGEQWSARSEKFIPAGSRVRMIGREGLVLVVEAV
jgi:membrane-bound serine protease (ClpP class)